MGDKTRVLFADDSEITLKILNEISQQLPFIDVVGVVRSGKEAVDAALRHQPDVVVMDVEMPEMDGAEAVQAMRNLGCNVPIIMFGGTSQKEVYRSLDALYLGANDFESKPSMAGHLTKAMAQIQERLVRKVVRWGRVQLSQRCQIEDRAVGSALPAVNAKSLDCLLSGIGGLELLTVSVDVGGYRSLCQFLSELPAGFQLPAIVEFPAESEFVKHLANQLNSKCRLVVQQAEPGAILEPGKVLIADRQRNIQVTQLGPRLVVDSNRSQTENSESDVDGLSLWNSVLQSTSGKNVSVLLGDFRSGLFPIISDLKANGGLILVEQFEPDATSRPLESTMFCDIANWSGRPEVLACELVSLMNKLALQADGPDVFDLKAGPMK